MTAGSPSRDPEAHDARRAALEVLGQVRRGRRLDRALAPPLAALPPARRSWLHELVYGTVRLQGRLDHLLDHFLHQGIESVSPLLLDLLRLGSYQLLKMGAVPAYAAVSETVEQARQVGGKGVGGLVNAVLRGVSDAGEDPTLFPDPEDDLAGWLTTWGSHPRWLVERWLGRLEPEVVSRLVEWNNSIPSVYLRPVTMAPGEAVVRLEKAQVVAREVGKGTGCLRLAEGSDPSTALKVVPGVVQDPGAALVTRFVAPPPGAAVADLCAAPGGKCLALAAEGAYVLAADRSGPRLRVLRENARRLGLLGLEAVGPGALGDTVPRPLLGTVRALAEAPPVRAAQVVLLDVPCTGTGTLRRHPDARWRLEPVDVEKLAGVQWRILEGAAAAVRPGGHLIYATCTLEPEENERQVRTFLERHPEFEIDPDGGVASEFLDSEGLLRVVPWEHGFDGAFAARLRRRP